MSELVDHLRWLADFAYKHGAHELGYDPVEAVAQMESEVARLFERNVSYFERNDRQMRGLRDYVSMWRATVGDAATAAAHKVCATQLEDWIEQEATAQLAAARVKPDQRARPIGIRLASTSLSANATAGEISTACERAGEFLRDLGNAWLPECDGGEHEFAEFCINCGIPHIRGDE